MIAAVFDSYGGPDVIRLVQVPMPEPGPGEVLIRTRFAAVNPIDCATRAGRGVSVEDFPCPLGWDVAGTVVAIGPRVSDLREGDEVFGMPRFPQHVGCCADYVISPASALAGIPPAVLARDAAAAPMVALTAWQALHQWSQSLAGRKVMIHGASGGVGHVAVQLAKRAGAHVTATASARNRDFLLDLGADEVHDYAQREWAANLGDIDLALDTRGGQDVGLLMRTVKPGGILVSLKGTVDRAAQEAAAIKRVQLRAIMVQPDRDVLIRIGEHLQSHSIRIETAAEFSLADIAKAHALVETGHARGRVLLRPGLSERDFS